MHESVLNKSLTFEYRVTCDNHYYGKGCAILCRGRDDAFGHYTCSAAGDRVCQTGWTGEYCDKRKSLVNYHFFGLICTINGKKCG